MADCSKQSSAEASVLLLPRMVEELHDDRLQVSTFETFTFSGRFHPKKHPYTTVHRHIHSGVNHAGRQPARREQLGLGALLSDTSTLRRRSQGSN